MLVKIENGFYLNAQHIIAVKVSKNAMNGHFVIGIDYTPNSSQSIGSYQKNFDNKIEAEIYFQTIHKEMNKS